MTWRIGNTPQQGINWIGEFPKLRGVIVKMVETAYDSDQWQGAARDQIKYYLKAQLGSVNRLEKANQALLLQPALGYPIIVLAADGDYWRCAGTFDVIADAWNTHVTLVRRT